MNIQQVQKLDQAYYMNCFGTRLPVMPVRGEGSTLYDENGNAYTDFLAGIAVNSLGYGHPRVTAAIKEQAEQLIHSCNYFYNEPQAKLARLLCTYSCGDKVFFSNSGAEANEGAIKLARAYFYKKGEDRYEVITATNSFHGRTLATVTATAQPKYQAPFGPLPQGFSYVPYGDLAALEAAIGPHTAAVMLEPIQGEGGVIESGKAYLEGVRKLCDENGILLIFDEVQCGMGRTGYLFAHQFYEVEPDIFTTAKALGSGLPIGAVLAQDPCCAFAPGDHGSTFSGNPLCCSVGLAVMETLLAPGFMAEVGKKGASLKAKLAELQNKFPEKIVDVRGQGLMIGAQFSEDIPVKDIQSKLLEKGYIVGTAGGNTLRLLPPLVITMGEINGLITALSEVL